MNEINNMGGILFADILSKNEIDLFAVNQRTACVRVVAGHSWTNLPTTGIIEAPSVTPEQTESSTIYKHTATIRFPRRVFSTKDENYLRSKIIEGCILRCQDASGTWYVSGTQEYPLFGTLMMVVGKKVTDFTGYELRLEGTSLHPLLAFMPL